MAIKTSNDPRLMPAYSVAEAALTAGNLRGAEIAEAFVLALRRIVASLSSTAREVNPGAWSFNRCFKVTIKQYAKKATRI